MKLYSRPVEREQEEPEETPETSAPSAGPPLFLALALAILPWVAVWVGLYRLRSAPIAFLLYHSLCLLGGFLLRNSKLPRTERVGPLRRRILFGVILAANISLVALYIWVGNLLLDRPRVLEQMEANALPPSTYFWLFPYFVIVNPFVEEYLWRAGIYAALRPAVPHWGWAALIASAFFGAWHWLVIRLFVVPWLALLATLAIVAVGMLLTLVYERHRRLIYPIALHALAGDLPLLLVLWLLGNAPSVGR